MNGIEKKIVYTNASAYKTSDADCERLVLGAMAKGMERIFVLPSSLPVVNRTRTDGIRVAVGVSYPSGAYEQAVKVHEIEDLLCSGEAFDEIYAVLAVGRYLSGYADECRAEMEAMAAAAGEKPVYFIMEAAVMTDGQKKEVVEMAAGAGARGIVASTGFAPYDIKMPGPEDIKTLAEAAAGKLEIIANGGIDSMEKIQDMLRAGAGLVCSADAYHILNG